MRALSRIVCLTTIVVLLVGACACFARGSAAPAAAPPLTASCPVYLADLERATIKLQQGDRLGAIAAVKEAKEALADCIRAAGEGESAVAFIADSTFTL